jgi:hypothetical protein
MLDIIECAKGKLHDPFVMDWALDQYERARDAGLPIRAEMEKAWFDEPTLRLWLEKEDDLGLTRLFRELPADAFRGLAATLLERWPQMPEQVAHWAAPLLFLNPAEDVAAVFEAHVGDGSASLAQHDARLQAIIKYATRLPTTGGRALLDTITAHVLAMNDEDWPKAGLLENLLAPSRVLRPENLPQLVETLVRLRLDAGRDPYEMLKKIVISLFGHAAWFEYAELVMDSRGAVRFEAVRALFTDAAPLQEAVKEMSAAKRR